MHSRPTWLSILLYLAAAALVLLAIGPALWLVAISFSTPGTPMNRPPMSRRELTTENYRGAWETGRLLYIRRVRIPPTTLTVPLPAGPFVNSVAVTAAQTFLNVLLASLAAFPLARMSFRGRDAIFVIILATLMIPEQVLVVPLFRTIVRLSLYDTLAAIVLPFSVSAFGIFLCRQAFLSIPRELEEAAQIDGAGALRVWWHVMLPLAAPTLATLAVFSIIGSWSSLLWPLIVLQSEQNFTLPVKISQLLGTFATNLRWAYAGSVIALVPMVVMYIVLQRWLQRGLLAGAVKG
jgi:putative chitobiose transport system permease protein